MPGQKCSREDGPLIQQNNTQKKLIKKIEYLVSLSGKVTNLSHKSVRMKIAELGCLVSSSAVCPSDKHPISSFLATGWDVDGN